MLSHEETLGLIVRAQNGEEEAKEKLIAENLPLIKSIVKRFKGRHEYDDLMQLGAMGFLKAVANFDASFGVRFSTYAVPMITGEIKRFLRDDGAVKVSRWAKTLAQKIAAYTDEALKNNMPEPTVDELAEKFGCEAGDVVFALDTGRFVMSLNETGDDDGTPLGDRIVGAEAPEEDIDGLMLRDSIKNLPERERKIIILRYFRDKTQSEVAAELGVSQVQVSRLENKILRKIREKWNNGIIAVFLSTLTLWTFFIPKTPKQTKFSTSATRPTRACAPNKGENADDRQGRIPRLCEKECAEIADDAFAHRRIRRRRTYMLHR